jgi:hypothetical protein
VHARRAYQCADFIPDFIYLQRQILHVYKYTHVRHAMPRQPFIF